MLNTQNTTLPNLLETSTLAPDDRLVLEALPYTEDEAAELEINLDRERKALRFAHPVLSAKADWDSVEGLVRNTGLGAFDSFFSGIGSSIAAHTPWQADVLTTFASIATSLFGNKIKVPIFADDFSIVDVGGRLMRAPIHVFDSIFSTIGEKFSSSKLAATGIGLGTVLSLGRVLCGREDQELSLPISSMAGAFGRSAVLSIESMLSSSAHLVSELFADSPLAGAFLAGSTALAGLFLPKNLKNKTMPWESLEGLVSQGVFFWADSFFASASNFLKSTKTQIIGLAGIGLTALGLKLTDRNPEKTDHHCEQGEAISKPNLWSYKIPFGKVEGKIIRSIFHAPEALIFNLASKLGYSALGLPLTGLYLAGTYLGVLKPKQADELSSKLDKDIPMQTIGGMVQRLPFDSVQALVSASTMNISNLVRSSKITSTLITVAAPVLSHKAADIFKGLSARFDKLDGLLIKHANHAFETLVSSSAHRTGQVLMESLGLKANNELSGSRLADGRWIRNGRIIPNMALAKQAA